MPGDEVGEATKWTIHGERVVDASRRLTLSVASVELLDGVTFEQYVLRIPKAAIVAVLDGRGSVLMMRRHRFVIDRWVWELPGGYVDAGEDPAVTAAREVEEETGWRPREVQYLMSAQPNVGLADAENLIYVARGADYVGEPADINEAQEVAWIPLESVLDRIASGEIMGASSQLALLRLMVDG
ncbi:NUDIX hydrolase [Kribbella endophytica]